MIPMHLNLKSVKALLNKAERHYERNEGRECIKALWKASRILAIRIEDCIINFTHEYFK